jgi:hypothetical protein
MIIDFSVSNYKFITERQTISLEALTGKRDKQSKDNIVNAKYRIIGGKTKDIKLLKDVYVFGKEEAMQNLKGAIELFNKIVSYDNFYKYKYKDCSTDLSKTNDEAIKFEITFLLDNIKYIYKIHYGFNCKIRQLVYYPKGKKKSIITNKIFKKALDYLSNNKLNQIKFSSSINDTSLMNKVRKDQIYLADFNDNVYIYPITDYYNSRKEDIENEYLCGRFGAIDRNNLKEY